MTLADTAVVGIVRLLGITVRDIKLQEPLHRVSKTSKSTCFSANCQLAADSQHTSNFQDLPQSRRGSTPPQPRPTSQTWCRQTPLAHPRRKSSTPPGWCRQCQERNPTSNLQPRLAAKRIWPWGCRPKLVASTAARKDREKGQKGELQSLSASQNAMARIRSKVKGGLMKAQNAVDQENLCQGDFSG